MSQVENRIRRFFPALDHDGFDVTSPATPSYNCIGWAAGDDSRWWEPSGLAGHYWPDGLPTGRGEHYGVQHYVAAYEAVGFERCTSADLEPDFEKVAVFADAAGSGTHAAKQLDDGSWTSKLGQLQDIRHQALDGVAGQSYGTVHAVLRRRVYADETTEQQRPENGDFPQLPP